MLRYGTPQIQSLHTQDIAETARQTAAASSPSYERKSLLIDECDGASIDVNCFTLVDSPASSHYPSPGGDRLSDGFVYRRQLQCACPATPARIKSKLSVAKPAGSSFRKVPVQVLEVQLRT